MKYLETIFAFLTSLVRIIFPRKQKPAAGDCPCPHPYPPIDIAGYSLMAVGLIGGLYKLFTA